MQMISYVLTYDIKALMIACNTATAVVLPDLISKLKIPVIGVIEPGARSAIRETKTGKIAVIGTEGTIRSGAYARALKKLSPSITVVSLACPTLVPFVESGNLNDPLGYEIVKNALLPLAGEEFDTLILGCTHYPLISHFIQDVVGPQVKLISSAEEAASELSAVLSHRGMLANGNDEINNHHRFFTSGDPELFNSIARNWLGIPVESKYVDLSKWS